MHRNEKLDSVSWKITPSDVLALGLGFGRTVAGVSMTTYGTIKMVEYITESENSQYTLPFLVAFCASTAVVNLGIRIPGTLIRNRLKIKQGNQPVEDIPLPHPLKRPYQGFSIFFQTMMYLSTLMSGFGALQSLMTMIMYNFKLNLDEIEDNDKIAAAVLTNALVLMICNIYSNATTPMLSAVKHVKKTSSHLQEGTLILSPLLDETLSPEEIKIKRQKEKSSAVKTIAITSIGLACQIAQGYNSSGGLKLIPYLRHYATDEMIHGVGCVSAITLFTYSLFTQVPSVYALFNKNGDRYIRAEDMPRHNRPFSVLIKTFGLIDALGFGVGNFIAITNTLKHAFGVDNKNPYVMGAVGVTSTIMFLMQYSFFTIENWKSVQEAFYQLYGITLVSHEQLDAIFKEQLTFEQIREMEQTRNAIVDDHTNNSAGNSDAESMDTMGGSDGGSIGEYPEDESNPLNMSPTVSVDNLRRSTGSDDPDYLTGRPANSKQNKVDTPVRVDENTPLIAGRTTAINIQRSPARSHGSLYHSRSQARTPGQALPVDSMSPNF